jgi:hypothetical protein
VVAAGGAVQASAGFATCGQPHMRGLGTPKTLISSHGPLSNRPYVWTKTADQILESIATYCTRINESRH